MKIIFTETTVKEFINDILNTSDKDIEEFDYYFIINGIFYPIDEVEIYTGEIRIRNTYRDEYIDVSTEEEGMIWHKEEK